MRFRPSLCRPPNDVTSSSLYSKKEMPYRGEHESSLTTVKHRWSSFIHSTTFSTAILLEYFPGRESMIADTWF